MEKSEELQIATSGKNMDIHRMELLPVVCLSVYKEIIKEMAELIEDKQIREIFWKRSSMCFTDNRHFVQESGFHV